MALKYVNSGAAGANDGTSWTDAWVSLGSSVGVAAGDEVRVHKTHSETPGATTWAWTNGTIANPVKIICVDKDNSDALDVGAAITGSSTLTLNGFIYVNGMDFAGTWLLLGTTGQFQCYENCDLIVIGATAITPASSNVRLKWINTDVDFSGATNAAVRVGEGGNATFSLEWFGGTYTCRGTQTNLFNFEGTGGEIFVRGVNISGTVTNLLATTPIGRLVLQNCKLPSYTNLLGGTPTNWRGQIRIEACSGSTISVPALGLTALSDNRGTITSTLAKYRTGGADDGEQANAHAWEMVTNANAIELFNPLVSPPLVVPLVEAGAHTLTVYVAGAASMNDDDVWVEVLSPSEIAATNQTTQSTFESTRCSPRGTPAALTTDGASTWNGSDVGTKQKISVSIAPTVAGPVIVRVFLAKPSTTVAVDPLVEVT